MSERLFDEKIFDATWDIRGPGGHINPWWDLTSNGIKDFIDAEIRKHTAKLESELAEAKVEIADSDALIKLQHSRTIKADKLWQNAFNKPHTYPDLGELVDWLLARAESAEAAFDKYGQHLPDCKWEPDEEGFDLTPCNCGYHKAGWRI